MKSNLLLLFMLSLSVSVLAQKKELKAAEKTFKKADYEATLEQLKEVEVLLGEADKKTKLKYYYIKAKSTYGDGKSTSNDKLSVEACDELIAFEKEIGSKKYTKEANQIINTIVQRTVAKGAKLFEEQEYSKASKKFEMVHNFSSKDTIYLDNAALAAYHGKDYDRAIELYNKLLSIGYTGISEQYRAKSIVDGEPVYYASKKDMDQQVKLKVVEQPEVIVSESRVGDIAKNIAMSYIGKGDNQGALDAITEAKKIFPNDYALVISEAHIYFQLGDNDKFLAGLKEAIKLKPNDPNLYFNIGVITLEQGYTKEAIAAFEKAIELKPDYGDAYNNIGVTILEKTKPIVEEMNKNLTNFKKYDQLMLKQKAVYKEALPYFEKALEFNPGDEGNLKTLVNLYELLGMYDKQKATKAKLDAL